MSFRASDEVILSYNKAPGSRTCGGVVVLLEEDIVQVALQAPGLAVKHGDLLHVKCESTATTAWGSVDHLEYAGDVKLLTLGTVRYEGDTLPRATRCQIDLTVSANFSDRDLNAKRTIGQTVNLSVSGIRARFRTTLPQGAQVHAIIHIDSERTIEAMARVVRIVEGTESAFGGYEVGLEFQRFIRGYEHLLGTAPEGTELPPEHFGDFPEDGEEWVA
jgi:hypothetical protein